MKKILSVAVLVLFFMIPATSFAKISAIADSDLEGIYGQSGPIEITFNDITVKDRILRTTSTDGLDFWNPEYDPAHGNFGHADYMLEAHSTPNNSDYENNMQGEGHIWTQYPGKGYFGMASVRFIGGKVYRSGSIILEVIPENDADINGDTVLSRCKLDVQLINQRIDANIAVESVLKLSPNQDLSGGGVLGRTYTSGVSMTNNGHLVVYAHNNNKLF
ncbi:MAG TPA: hypothetical protein PLT45_08205 [Smithella sp.]|nr:hypothetical protein [Smithella sp.]